MHSDCEPAVLAFYTARRNPLPPEAMMRFASLLPVPAFADEPATSSPAVILRGRSGPPPEPKVVVQPIHVPLYYPPFAYGPIVDRHRPLPAARRTR